MKDFDKYIKLKPPYQTPDSDICKCVNRPPIVLQSHLTYNPISCADCNLEVNLNQMDFTDKLVEQIADWRNFHDCFYGLWLDSGEFEDWAKEQLFSAESPVNKRGLDLRNQIATITKCFYRWFIDNSGTDFKPITKCPNCFGVLTKRENLFKVNTYTFNCCNIIIAN